jgi:hypothetical protein
MMYRFNQELRSGLFRPIGISPSINQQSRGHESHTDENSEYNEDMDLEDTLDMDSEGFAHVSQL